jgi:hypothetical protein
LYYDLEHIALEERPNDVGRDFHFRDSGSDCIITLENKTVPNTVLYRRRRHRKKLENKKLRHTGRNPELGTQCRPGRFYAFSMAKNQHGPTQRHQCAGFSRGWLCALVPRVRRFCPHNLKVVSSNLPPPQPSQDFLGRRETRELHERRLGHPEEIQRHGVAWPTRHSSASITFS